MTVKPKKRGRPTRGGKSLTQETIVSCAKEWMLSENKKLSIRALANRLAVDPMAIYHYFANKSQLMEAITVSIMQDIYRPDPAASWKEGLKQLCVSYLILLRDHPGLLETLLSMEVDMDGPAEVFKSRFEQATTGLRLDDDQKHDAMHLLVDYIHGAAFAMHCAKGKNAMTIADIDGPVDLYLTALAGFAVS